MRSTRPRTGFTIVEILVVMVILALLVNAAYQVYGSSVENARFQTMRSQVSMMRKAIEEYHATTGFWPPSLEALSQKYINRVPDDPLTGSDGNDWLVIGPSGDRTNPTSWWRADNLKALSPPKPLNLNQGVFDVRSSTGL